jgi:hypothetical protein
MRKCNKLNTEDTKIMGYVRKFSLSGDLAPRSFCSLLHSSTELFFFLQQCGFVFLKEGYKLRSEDLLWGAVVVRNQKHFNCTENVIVL